MDPHQALSFYFLAMAVGTLAGFSLWAILYAMPGD